MSRIVTARQNEPLDALIWRETGQGADAIAPVLNANPGLSVLAERLPEGQLVTIPDLLPAVATRDIVNLWD